MRAGQVAYAAVALAGVAALAGCVERKMVIRSNPAGARVLLDDEVVEGRTPVEVPFDWGGLRHVTLMAPGHKVLEASAQVEDPWFTRFPADLFTDLLWPGTIYDVQEFDFGLEAYHPAEEPFSDAQLAEIDARMEALKGRAGAARGAGRSPTPPATTSAPSPSEPPPPPPPPANGGR